MKIIENFLAEHDLEDLKTIVLGSMFPWYLNDGVTTIGDGHIQFTHLMYRDNAFTSSFTMNELELFREKLGFTKILRAKFNLLQRTEQIIEHGLHTDLENPGKKVKTAILYLNSNDGYTRFETGEKIASVENTLVLFDGSLKHCGTTCTNKKYRAVFNLNFEMEENDGNN